jgi:beta-lactamase regulating signal transducer with metallopeptidase domain
MSPFVLSTVNSWAATWAEAMLRACWQGGLLALAVWLFCRLRPRLSATVRCCLWWLVCLKLLVGIVWLSPVALPLLSAPPLETAKSTTSTPKPPDFHIPAIFAPSTLSQREEIERIQVTVVGSVETTAESVAPRTGELPPTLETLTPMAICLVVWLVGIGMQSGLILWQLARIRCFVRGARPLTDAPCQAMAAELAAALDLRRTPDLLVSSESESPMAIGWRHSVVLLPEAKFTPLTPEESRLLLAHEFAHFRRGDLWWSLVPLLARLLFFFHPLAWLAAREYELAREAACDAEAVQTTGSRPDAYGHLLVKLATQNDAIGPLGALGVTAHFRMLHRRLTMLQYVPSLARPLKRTVWLSVVLATLFLIPWRVVAAPDDPFADDVRLNQKVLISAEGIPVRDLIEKITQKTRVPLETEDYVAEDKIVLFGPPRPLKDVLSDIAALFNDTWIKTKSEDGTEGYRLVRLRKARDYEDALARDDINRMRKQLDAQARALNETEKQLAKRPESDPIRERLSKPLGRLATQYYALLSPVQREQLFVRNHLKIPFSSLTATQQGPLRVEFEKRREREKDVIARDPQILSQEWLNNSGLVFKLTRQGRMVKAEVDLGYGTMTILDWTLPLGSFESGKYRLLPLQGDPYTRAGVSADAPQPKPEAIQRARGEKQGVDRLRVLADAAAIPIMADYYRCFPAREEATTRFPSADQGPPDSLDALARDNEQLWWTRGGTLLFRRRDWFAQRLVEVPDRWMQTAIKGLKERKEVPTYSDALRLMELTDAQLSGLINLSNLPMRGDQRNVSGLRLLLSIFASSRERFRGPLVQASTFLPEGASRVERRQQMDQLQAVLYLLYQDLSLEQRGLVAAFAEAQPHPVLPTGIDQFSARLSYGEPYQGSNEFRHLSLELCWSWKGTAAVQFLCLPLSLPDDRTAKTRIEVVP